MQPAVFAHGCWEGQISKSSRKLGILKQQQLCVIFFYSYGCSKLTEQLIC